VRDGLSVAVEAHSKIGVCLLRGKDDVVEAVFADGESRERGDEVPGCMPEEVVTGALLEIRLLTDEVDERCWVDR